MLTAARLVAALVPLISIAALEAATLVALFRTPLPQIPDDWRWRLQRPLFPAALSPLLIASRAADQTHATILGAASAVSLLLLFPVFNAIFSELSYYPLFRPKGLFGGRSVQGRYALTLVMLVVFLLAAIPIVYVVLDS